MANMDADTHEAVKHHQCDSCDGRILPGEIYLRASGLCDRGGGRGFGFLDEKYCLDCFIPEQFGLEVGNQ